MCGISFAIGSSDIKSFIEKSNLTQLHRGPDSQNSLFERHKEKNIGFSHQRLSIFDLSTNGSQPMKSHSENSLIIFNGEIYNFRQLASKYQLNNLHSTSDTEVALELIEMLGIDKACQEFNGMWALVYYDLIQEKIFFSRDRFGKKPLNYLYHNDSIYAASELKTFLSIVGYVPTPDPLTAARFISQSLQNIDHHTWLSNVSAFPPASIGEIDLNEKDMKISNIRKFWSLDSNSELEINQKDSISAIKDILDDSMSIRLQADVPVGIALSGGLDSSILAATANNMKMDESVHIFSAVNPGNKNDESKYIDIVADHLNLGINKFSLEDDSIDDLTNLLSLVIYHNDGPISSFSSVLFYKLMEIAASKNIKVVLTGQGADEVFCGYTKYPIVAIQSFIKNHQYLKASNMLFSFLRRNTLIPQVNYVQAKRYLGKRNDSILGESSKSAMIVEPLGLTSQSIRDLQLADISKYSVPSLCHYEDRMSMAHSIEIRCPFLDYRLVELGYSLPLKAKLNKGWTKYGLRKAYESILPSSIVWRKDKKGFVNPEDMWLKENLRENVFDIMGSDQASVYKYGLVDKISYMKLFERYCKGDKTIWFREVFAPYSLELWLKSFGI